MSSQRYREKQAHGLCAHISCPNVPWRGFIHCIAHVLLRLGLARFTTTHMKGER